MSQLAVRMLMLGLLFPASLVAQSVTLSGTATDAKGKPIANATVSLKPAQGSPLEVRTDGEGNYTFANLAPGDYTISASGGGLAAKPIALTITTMEHQTEDLLLAPGAGQELPGAPSPAPSQEKMTPTMRTLRPRSCGTPRFVLSRRTMPTCATSNARS